MVLTLVIRQDGRVKRRESKLSRVKRQVNQEDTKCVGGPASDLLPALPAWIDTDDSSTAPRAASDMRAYRHESTHYMPSPNSNNLRLDYYRY
jgi:hypothetical protein